jgi:hypothetical protein
VLDEARELIGHERGGPPEDWALWWRQLWPYLVAVAALGLWLVAWAIISVRRVRRARTLPQPQPLTLAEAAVRVGATEAQLQAWRSLKLAVVQLDAQEHLTVAPHTADSSALTPDSRAQAVAARE